MVEPLAESLVERLVGSAEQLVDLKIPAESLVWPLPFKLSFKFAEHVIRFTRWTGWISQILGELPNQVNILQRGFTGQVLRRTLPGKLIHDMTS